MADAFVEELGREAARAARLREAPILSAADVVFASRETLARGEKRSAAERHLKVSFWNGVSACRATGRRRFFAS